MGTELQNVFTSFAVQGGVEMESRSFVKLCKDAGLLDSKCTNVDADLIFAKVKSKGGRRISFSQFQEALRLLADRKKINYDEIEEKVIQVSQPKYTGTVAQPNRFHDDKSLYTGVHAYGGPTTVDKGRSGFSDLSELTDRTSCNIRGVSSSVAENVAGAHDKRRSS